MPSPYFFVVFLSTWNLLATVSIIIKAIKKGTYIDNEPHVAEHNSTATQKGDSSLLPVRRISSTVKDDTPEGPHRHRSNVHAVQRNTSQSIIAGSLENNICPAKDQWVDHVRRTSKVKGKHGSAHREVLDKQHGSHNDLKNDTDDGHGNALTGGIHMPCCEHICQDTDGLHTEGISVDLDLGEFVVIVLEPQEEAVLEGEAFGTGADGGPEEQNPADMKLEKITDAILDRRHLQHGSEKDSLDQGHGHNIVTTLSNTGNSAQRKLLLRLTQVTSLGILRRIRKVKESKDSNRQSNDTIFSSQSHPSRTRFRTYQ